MKSLELLLTGAMVGTLALGPGVTQAADKAPMEKCYGITKAGMNDCQTASTACAGTAKQDGQKDAWLLLPKGTCEKIVGGAPKSTK
jgi:uncharacterized membrane protein